MAGMEVGLAKAGLDVFFALLGIPPPITIGSYNKQVKAVQKVCSCGFRYFAFLSISFVKFRKLKELIIKIKGSTHIRQLIWEHCMKNVNYVIYILNIIFSSDHVHHFRICLPLDSIQ